MKWIETGVSFDKKRIIFYYTAPTRVDFRALLQDCIRQIPKLIRFEQIGVRDAAKLLGGKGPCGRMLCCASFLTNLQPVSADQIEIQNLTSLGKQKLYGICGKLMCCLNFESPFYRQNKKIKNRDPFSDLS